MREFSMMLLVNQISFVENVLGIDWRDFCPELREVGMFDDLRGVEKTYFDEEEMLEDLDDDEDYDDEEGDYEDDEFEDDDEDYEFEDDDDDDDDDDFEDDDDDDI